jgi:FkbM family methyltransferase
MQNDEILRAADIQIVPMAVTNFDGKSSFFVVDSASGEPGYQRGMSSLYERSDSSLVQTSIQVAATRLDTFLSANHVSGGNIAVWMDVEGKAFEALQGASSLFPSICLLHVEVETQPCIAAKQKVEDDVRELLLSNGFWELARDSDERPPQVNLVFIRADLSQRSIGRAVRSARIGDARFRLQRFLRRLRASVRGRR